MADEPMAGPLSGYDLHLFNEGTHYRLYDKLGARPMRANGVDGVWFGVWAPNAASVSVVGDFNDWKPGVTPLSVHAESGIWQGFVPGLGLGAVYKYHVASRVHEGYSAAKADPMGVRCERPPRTASVVHTLDYDWGDEAWMAGRRAGPSLPMSVYELHLGSWMRLVRDDGSTRALTYRALAKRLPAYVRDLGFTHVELMPVMEHPLYRSWGYQTTGYFAPTARYGTAQDLMFLIDALHQAGIGVILDWVPSHFPSDEHGPGYFDGTHLYEHADPRQGFHPEWTSLIFNYERHEVRSFLISSAMYWLEKYHADGLRVDAVASMLYLDYSREAGEWIPNREGGRENLAAVDFLQRLNTEAYRRFPTAFTVAEESTSWPGVTLPVHEGGLGFGFKWDMGWMHDTLKHLTRDPVHRRHHHAELTFRAVYQHSENYVLPLSHDEVVHGKGSLVNKAPGDEWQRLASLRLLLANQWMQPGKKLLFMGGEIAQEREWSEERGLDWELLARPGHAGVQALVRALNQLHRERLALHEMDGEYEGFEWVDEHDADRSLISFLRWSADRDDVVLVVQNATPVVRYDVPFGVPRGGAWLEILNTDATAFGGSGTGNLGRVESSREGMHGREWCVRLALPPLSVIALSPE